MSPTDADVPGLKYRLAPLLAAGARAWTHPSSHPGTVFQTIILHHIPDSQLDALRDFLDFVQREHGFITPVEAAARLAGSATDSRGVCPCLLTFDDGFASAIPVARDFLAPLGINAIFFVCPGLIDLPPSDQSAAVARNVLRDEYLDERAPALMNWTDLHALADNGHAIGAHGSMHLRLSDLDGDALEREIVGAGDRIAEQLGRFPDWYAYAFGDIGAISPAALGIIRQHYRHCRTGVRGRNDRRNPFGLVNAQEIDLRADRSYQRAILDSALDIRYWFARRTLRRYAAR